MPRGRMPRGQGASGLRRRNERQQRMNASDTLSIAPAGTRARRLEPPPLQGLPESERTLLIVDDDAPLCQRLARAMERRGFVVATADQRRRRDRRRDRASARLRGRRPAARRRQRPRCRQRACASARPGARIVVLTGYGNIATAVAAVKAGAARLSAEAGRCRRGRAGAAGPGGRDAGAAGRPDVGRPGALGTYPAHLRAVRPQRLRDRAAPQDAPPHLAAHPSKHAPRS